ncbi:T9SS type A sorting domain-containing protein, partial [bacterium]|nr:T9SS type A sorting domain-containing protein [bacterium]
AEVNQSLFHLVADAQHRNRDGNNFYIPWEGQATIDLNSFLAAGDNWLTLKGSGQQGAYANIVLADFAFSVPTGVNVHADQQQMPEQFALWQNYPNPFNPATTIRFDVPLNSNEFVSLKIYDVEGKLVRTLVSRRMKAGSYIFTWNGQDDIGRSVSSGIYFCRMTAGNFTATRKLVFTK